MKQVNPFTIKDTIGRIKGFTQQREQGGDFWLSDPGEKLYLALSRQKIRSILIIVMICLVLILARVFWLQVVQGENYKLIAESNRIRLQSIKAERGIIYDRFFRPLVSNIPNSALYFTPADLPKDKQVRNELINELVPLINKNYDEIKIVFDNSSPSSYQPQLIINNLNHQQTVILSVRQDNLPGIQLMTEPQRKYLEGHGLAHILSYVAKINQEELELYQNKNYGLNDSLGKNGIELYYEDILRGTNGKREIEVDAMGKPKKILNEKDAVMGNGLVLSIDLDLQKKLAQSLKQAIWNAQTTGGVAIALDPRNGEILALVSLPDYDNNFFTAGIQQDAYQNYLNDPKQPLFNRAISGTYPPGSIFKPIVAMAALEQGIINVHKTFLSTGGLQIDKWFFPDWKYGGHGRVNVVKAIAESVNTFFYYIGGGYNDFVGLGVKTIVEYAKKFNLAQELGIDLPGEKPGFLPSKEWKEEYKQEPWYIGDTYHLAIGQGDILVTPLQVAAYTATIANGGTLYQPHLLKEIKTHNDNGLPQAHQLNSNYILQDNFAKRENVEVVKQGLRQTVLSGSAKSLQALPVAVAGKTGTAQVGGDKKTHAWFIGFAPYETPQIVLVVLIENGGEGSSVAVPVFREVIEWYFDEN